MDHFDELKAYSEKAKKNKKKVIVFSYGEIDDYIDINDLQIYKIKTAKELKNNCPVADRLVQTVLALPMWPELENQEIDYDLFKILKQNRNIKNISCYNISELFYKQLKKQKYIKIRNEILLTSAFMEKNNIQSINSIYNI